MYDNKGYVQDDQNMYAKVQKPSPASQRAPQPVPEPAIEVTQRIDVEIRDDSPDPSPPQTPVESPRSDEPADEDFRIVTEVMWSGTPSGLEIMW